MKCHTRPQAIRVVYSKGLQNKCRDLHGNISDTKMLPLSMCFLLDRYEIENNYLRGIFKEYIGQIYLEEVTKTLEDEGLNDKHYCFF